MSDIDGSNEDNLQERIEAAVDDRVSAELRTLERRVMGLEERTKGQLRDMLSTMAKQKVAIDSAHDKISKISTAQRSSPAFGDDVLARLDRAEKAAGILPDNKLDVYERLSALESRLGVFEPISAWGSPASASRHTRNGRPASALRAFVGDGYKTSLAGLGHDFERVQTAPIMTPRAPMSAERPSRPMSTPITANRTASILTPGNFEGVQLAGTKEISDLDFASSFAPNSPDANPSAQTEKNSSESVMNTLAEMNKIIRSEQDAKSEYQMRITELSFALEQKRIREEESRTKIANLEELTKELHARQELLQEQKETLEASLKTAKEQLRRAQDVSDRKNNSKVKSLQQQIQEMNNSLQQAKTLNSEYEISLKRIGNQRRDEEDAKRVALEERDYLENALRKARADLEKHRRAQEEAEEQQRAALKRAEDEAEHHRQIQLDFERQASLAKKSKEDLEKEYKLKVELFEEQQAAFKKLEEELQQQKQMFHDLQKQQEMLIQSTSEQRGAQGDQMNGSKDEWRQEKERLEKQVQSQNELQQRQQAALRRAKEELESQRKVQQDLERQIAELKTGGNINSPAQTSASAPLRRASSVSASSSRSPQPRSSFSTINEEEDPLTRSTPSPMRRQSSANMPSPMSNSNGLTAANTPSRGGDVDSDSQIELLKAELLKEMALLKEIDTMREGMKDEIKNWMDNFAARNGRTATVEERAPVAPRYQAYKEAGELRERVVNRINEIKARGREATLAARSSPSAA